MVSRNRLQFSQNQAQTRNSVAGNPILTTPLAGTAKPRAIGSILDAVLARYGIEVEEVTVELTKNNTTIISSPSRKSPVVKTKSPGQWSQRFLF
jgi:hypothetical protein